MTQERDVVVVTATLTRPHVTALLTAFPRMHLRRLRVAALVGLVGTTTVVAGDLVTFGGVRTASLVIVAVVTALAAVMLLGAPWLQSARAAERAGVGVAMTWTFTPAGLTTRSVLGESEIGWDRVADLRRTPEVVAMLWRPQMCATGLPAGALDATAFERVSGWWRAAGTAGTDAVRTAPADADGTWGGPVWDDAVAVHGPMTLAAMRRMQLAVIPRRTLVLLAVALLLLAGPVLLRVLVDGPGSMQRTDAGSLLVAVIACVGVPLLVDLSMRRGVRRLGGGDSAWRATPTSLTLRTPLGRSEVPWARVDRVVERGGFLVASTRRPRTAIAMPTTGLSAQDLDAVRRWAAAHGARVPGAAVRPSSS